MIRSTFRVSRDVRIGALAVVSLSASTLPAQTSAEALFPRSEKIVIEAEALLPVAIATQGGPHRQEMGPFGASWGGNAQLFWAPKEPGARLRLGLEIERTGAYDVVLVHTTAPDYARLEVQLDAGPTVELEGFAAGVGRAENRLGTAELDAGTHVLMLTVTGKDPRSTGYYAGLDRIELHVPQQSPRAEGPPDAAPPPPAPIETWSANDVIDPRIDVAAQRVLIASLSADGERGAASAGLVSAVKSGELGGIYQEDQAVPARLAQSRGIGWWQLIPAGRDHILVASPGETEPPIAAFRRALAQSPERLVVALTSLWVELGAPRGSNARCAGRIPGPGCDASCEGWRRDNESISAMSAEEHLRKTLGFTTIPAVASVSCVAAPGYFAAQGRLCTVRYQASDLAVEIGLPDPQQWMYCGCQCVFAREIAPTAHGHFDIYGCYCSPQRGLRLVPTGGVQPNPYARP